MADANRPGRDDPEAPNGYDWLYSVERKGVGSSGAAPPDDAEATQVLRRPVVDPHATPRQGPEQGPAAGPATGPPTGPPTGPATGTTAPVRPVAPPPPPARPPVVPAPPPGTGGGKAPRQRGPRRRRFRVRWLVLLLVLWLAFLVAVPLLAWRSVSRVNADPAGDRPPEQPGTTYLVVGSDEREGLSGRRTDTIMLLHIGSGPNLLMSIPRDSNVDIPGRGTDKINAAFAFGGPELLVQTIESNTGIRVDDYVEIGFTGFTGLVDAVGGIEICPTERMQDPDANLDIRRGCQEVDGATALGYARSRKTSALGDVDRARHQREVVSAVGSEVVDWRTVVNPLRYYRVAFAAAESVRIEDDMGMVSAGRFAYAMTRLDGADGLTCGVPIVDLAVTWDEERAGRLFSLVAEDRTGEVGRALCTPSGLPR